MSDRDGNEEVYVMNPDGSGPVNLTNNPAIDLQPTFRPPARRSCSKPIEMATPRSTR